ncbi:DNA-binding response OmpR family regulator [Thermoanaerobacterium thermosaccharolyticum]|nr:DNA-binding response OmpR family regulator [Thermoanaerobacterium thermosaccharolyticum]
MAKVLVIEDEEGMRDILKTYLEKNNFDALFAEDGNTGINMFKNNSFDIVLLDVMLPDMSGCIKEIL